MQLRVGDVIDLGGQGLQTVWYVNESRAACVPASSVHLLEHKVSKAGKDEFLSDNGTSINISPNSQVPVVKRMGVEGLVQAMQESPATHTKPAAAGQGPFAGFHKTAILRAFGAAGWSVQEARAGLGLLNLHAEDTTIRSHLRKGRQGKKAPAPVSQADLAALKAQMSPTPAEKPQAGPPRKQAKPLKTKKAVAHKK